VVASVSLLFILILVFMLFIDFFIDN